MPKALAVAQAERVARIMVPAINVIAMLVYPVGKLMQVSSLGCQISSSGICRSRRKLYLV